MLKAAGLLASFKDEGIVFDSYLEDGYPGVFHDYANYVGWAMVERYIFEELMGAPYCASWGGLTQSRDQVGGDLALDAVNPELSLRSTSRATRSATRRTSTPTWRC